MKKKSILETVVSEEMKSHKEWLSKHHKYQQKEAAEKASEENTARHDYWLVALSADCDDYMFPLKITANRNEIEMLQTHLVEEVEGLLNWFGETLYYDYDGYRPGMAVPVTEELYNEYLKAQTNPKDFPYVKMKGPLDPTNWDHVPYFRSIVGLTFERDAKCDDLLKQELASWNVKKYQAEIRKEKRRQKEQEKERIQEKIKKLEWKSFEACYSTMHIKFCVVNKRHTNYLSCDYETKNIKEFVSFLTELIQWIEEGKAFLE